MWGDKIGGDPNTKDSGLEWYIGTFLESGYNVVSPNYVFAPEYLYPTSLLQLNECVKYCMSIYFTDVEKISAAFVGILMIVARILDAISDMVMGAVIEKTNTKMGKCRPFSEIITIFRPC